MSATDRDLAATIDANIASNLRSARERAGLSQSELARRVTEFGLRGFYQTTVARIESAQRALRAAEAVALCRVLDITIESLADTPQGARLRETLNWVGRRADEFEAAARNLIQARRMLADELEAVSSERDDAGDAGASQELVAFAEHALTDAAAHLLLRDVYRPEVDAASNGGRAKRAARESGTRVEALMGEMADWLERNGDDG